MPVARGERRAPKEPLCEQIASFVGFFIYLLVLKSFLLPLFIIPTGSMAETLYGAHATHTCPNCGTEYPVGLGGTPPRPPAAIQCPNCRWLEQVGSAQEWSALKASGVAVDGSLRDGLRARAGDRIMVHGWTYDLGGMFGPRRWDVVVFKVPSDGQTNYIKRLIGKPGETIEIIDGDIFVTDPQTGRTAIARKPRHAQRSLWFPYYDHDHPARQAGAGGTYHPRWTALAADSGWTGLDTRRPRFDGLGGRAGELLFVTAAGATREPGEVADVYGYNTPCGRDQRGALVPLPGRPVSDVRLSAEVTFEAAADSDGFIELSASKHGARFFARLYAGGRVTLECAAEGGPRQSWGSWADSSLLGRPVRLALSNVDYAVAVEVNGRAVIQSTSAQYDVTPEQARARSQHKASPRLGIAAQGVRCTLARVRIERDVYYTSDMPGGGRGTQGHPITLGRDEYFVMGDNSPASLDARFAFAQEGADPVGPHLKAAFAQHRYQLGTVPADQLIGPAFLVYWPGTDALVPDEGLPEWVKLLNQLPGPGRIRWIH